MVIASLAALENSSVQGGARGGLKRHGLILALVVSAFAMQEGNDNKRQTKEKKRGKYKSCPRKKPFLINHK